MTVSKKIDQEKLAEAALAILSLTAHEDQWATRAWKGLDWDLLSLLHDRGWIDDPVGKQKSVVFTDEGKELAVLFLEKHFAK
jgi:predicted HD phosphohydrolase